MNVGELLKERDRLLDVVEEAKLAKSRIKQLNILIAMYGDAENVSLNGHGKIITEELYCGKCEAGPFSGDRGISMHNKRMHGGRPKVLTDD